MVRRLPTWYVNEPRDQSCAQVNPGLWREFQARHGAIDEPNELHSEAYCVQWLDRYYEAYARAATNQS